MENYYSITNFRSFGPDGAKIDFAPVTFITGENSSGKSSIVKSLVLFENYLRDCREVLKKGGAYCPFNCYLNFSDPALKLGRFNSTISISASQDNGMSFEYGVESKLMNQEIRVRYTFVHNNMDDLDNGILGELTVVGEDGEVLFKWERDEDDVIKLEISRESIKKLRAYFIKFSAYSISKRPKQPEYLVDIFAENSLIDSIVDKQDINQYDEYIDRWAEFRRTNSMYFINFLNNIYEVDKSVTRDIIKYGTSIFSPILNHVRGLDKSLVRERIFSLLAQTNMPKDYVAIASDLLVQYENSPYHEFTDFLLDWMIDNVYCRPQEMLSFQVEDHWLFSPQELFYTGYKQNINTISFLIALSNSIDTSYQTLCDDKSVPLEFDLFNNYVSLILHEIMFPEFVGNIVYVGTSNIELKRMYTIGEDKSELSDVIVKYFALKKKWDYMSYISHNRYTPGDFINHWIKRFELGENFEIVFNELGQGVSLYIDGKLLADQGHGVTQLLTILINIEIAILQSICKKSQENKDEEYIGTNKDDFYPQTVILEEPEIHLHPRFQSLLADMFRQAYSRYNVQFIIETHSEYLIRKSQVLVSRMRFHDNAEADKRCGFRTIYVPKIGSPYSLVYRKDGKFAEDFGPGFFDESSMLMLEIL